MICEYGNSFTLSYNDYSLTVTFSKLDKDTIDIATWKVKQIFREKNLKYIYYDLVDCLDPSDEKFNGISYFVKRIKDELHVDSYFDNCYKILR